MGAVLMGFAAYVVLGVWATLADAPAVLACLLLFGIVGVVGLAGYALRATRARARLDVRLGENTEAVAALRAGRVRDAVEIWERLLDEARALPSVHALYLQNLGVAYLHACEPERAIELLTAAKQAGWHAHLHPQLAATESP